MIQKNMFMILKIFLSSRKKRRMNATEIKLLFKANSPTQFAQRSLMIRRPEKMKVRTFQDDSIVWPTLNKNHQVLLLGPEREQSGKLVMTDQDARSIFQKIGYHSKNIYRTPKGGMVVFVKDFPPLPVQQKSIIISPIPVYHGKRSSSSRPRTPATPFLSKQLYS
jgi:hypothetical protein